MVTPISFLSLCKIPSRTIFLLLFLPLLGSAEEVKKLVDKKYALEALVISLDKTSNSSFVVLDIPKKKARDNVLSYWDSKKYHFLINGGFFDPEFKPVGYYKLNDKVINKSVSKKFSGFIALDNKGKIALLTKNDDLKKYQTVIQVGPYVIDPGGKIGIKSRNGKISKRTLIGITKDQEILIIITKPIQLYDLALAVKSKIPKLERLLNLDGGPSTALVCKSEKIINKWPVRNYIAKKITDAQVNSKK